MTLVHVSEWNFQTVALTQALLGSISPNFRMVSLDRDDDAWVINFFIETDDDDDRDEIDEIVALFEAQQDGQIECKCNIFVGHGDIDRPIFPARAVFLRREQLR